MEKSLLISLSLLGKVETCGKGGLLPTILVALTMDIVAPLNKRVNLIQPLTEARLHDADVLGRPAIVSS